MIKFLRAALSLRNLIIFSLGGLAMIILLLLIQLIISKSLVGFWDDDLIFPALIGGLIALGYISYKSKQNTYTIENCLAIDLTSVYWHFLALLWLFLFVLINFY